MFFFFIVAGIIYRTFNVKTCCPQNEPFIFHTLRTLMIIDFRNTLTSLYMQAGVSEYHSDNFAQFTCITCVLVISLLITFGMQRVLVAPILQIVGRTHAKWDDYLINSPVLKALCQLLPSIMVYVMLPFCVKSESERIYTILYHCTQAYIALSCTMLVSAFLKNLIRITTEHYEIHKLVGVLQFLRIITIFLGTIVIVSYLFGNNPLRVIAGLGAAATVLMLVFKDFLLGLVAGVQLSMNNMLKVGDWISIDKLHIDGIVEEVTLTTVKVRNFDNAISTIPAYTLVSDSFKNWQGMISSGLRRVKRALYIDVQSVSFADSELKACLKRKKYISIADVNDDSATNLTLFRHFITEKLRNCKQVAAHELVLARQLEPTPNGLPLEIWFYTTETTFDKYEDLASYHLEYFLAIMSEFKLRPYQAPSGHDLKKATTQN